MEELDQGFKGFDFKAAIEDLKARALLARQTRRIIAISMFFAIFTAVTVVYFLMWVASRPTEVLQKEFRIARHVTPVFFCVPPEIY